MQQPRFWTKLLPGILALAIVLFGGLSGPIPRAGAAGASIGLSRSMAASGDGIVVTGTGFAPQRAVLVTVDFSVQGAKRHVTTTAATNASGAFTATLMVPTGTSPGAYTVVASGPRTQATANLIVLRLIRLKAGSQGPKLPILAGHRFFVRGSGFAPGDAVQLTARFSLYSGDSLTETKNLVADQNGRFGDVLLHVPANARDGDVTLTVTAPKSQKAGATITVIHRPTITVNPQTIRPGGSLTVGGAGFVPGAQVTLSVTIPRTGTTNITLSKTVAAGPQGGFQASMSLPANTKPGSYSLTAAGSVAGFKAVTAVTVTLAAAISVQPQTILPGQKVTVSGAGFSAGIQVQVSATFPLFVGGTRTVSATTTTNGNGEFSVQILAPARAAAGPVTVTAKGPNAQAGVRLQVQPLGAHITLTPATIRPGSNVTVQGAGYLAGSKINIGTTVKLTNGTSLPLTTSVTTNSNGQFTVQLHIPGNVVGGVYTVVGSAAASGRAPVARLTVNRLAPSISVIPATVRPGSTVTIQGSGFLANSAITVSVNVNLTSGGTTTLTTSATTNGQGQFSATLHLAGNVIGGTYTLNARSAAGRSSTTRLTISRLAPSVSLAPSSVIPGGSATVRGAGYLPSSVVTVSVSVRLTNGTTKTITTSATTNSAGQFAATIAMPGNAAGGAYTIVARSAAGRSSSARLTVATLAPSIVAVPTTAVPGTQITVNGFGFAAGSALTISLQGVNVGTASTNGSGQFSLKVTIPSTTATGSYSLSAAGTGGRTASINLAVNRAVSTHFYFASLYTGRGYHEYLAFLNPTAIRASVQITYQPKTGVPRTKSISVAAHSRFTEDVNADVGVHVAAGAVVAADVPIAAERLVYHGLDGAVVPGVTHSSTTWYFANGNTSHGYREYIAVQNPNSGPVQVALHLLPTHHHAFTVYRTMPATSRTTFNVNSLVHQDAVGATVTANGPIVANRTIFVQHGMTSKIGVTAPQRRWYFAAGTTRGGARNWIGVINTSSHRSFITLHAYGPLGSELGIVREWLKPFARKGYVMNRIAHRTDVAVLVTTSRPSVVEQTTYVGKLHNASTDAFGVQSPAKTWEFAAANTMPGQSDVLSLFNPNLAPIAVAVQFMNASGGVTQRTYVIAPLTHQRIDVGSVMPNAQLGIVAASSEPFVALNRGLINNGQGAMSSAGIPG